MQDSGRFFFVDGRKREDRKPEFSNFESDVGSVVERVVAF